MMLQAFFSELEKISAAGGFGGVSANPLATSVQAPVKPTEVQPPIKPRQLKAKVIGPKKGLTTNYTQSNVEAPKTDVGVTAAQKVVAPPSATT